MATKTVRKTVLTANQKKSATTTGGSLTTTVCYPYLTIINPTKSRPKDRQRHFVLKSSLAAKKSVYLLQQHKSAEISTEDSLSYLNSNLHLNGEQWNPWRDMKVSSF